MHNSANFYCTYIRFQVTPEYSFNLGLWGVTQFENGGADLGK